MQAFGEVIDSPRPVMTFRVAGECVAIPVEQVERVAQTAQLWPVPLSFPHYLGLFDDGGELIPVLRLEPEPKASDTRGVEQLVAILHVRGESMGLAVERAGRVYHGFRTGPAEPEAPPVLQAIGARAIVSGDGRSWLIDPDNLWRDLATPDPL